MCGKQPMATHVYLFSKIDVTLNSKTFKRAKIKKKTHTQDSQSIQTTQNNSNEQRTNVAQSSSRTVILL